VEQLQEWFGADNRVAKLQADILNQKVNTTREFADLLKAQGFRLTRVIDLFILMKYMQGRKSAKQDSVSVELLLDNLTVRPYSWWQE
jgi:enamine deaminase RidA (YjgF/YER057c/UK114 family)